MCVGTCHWVDGESVYRCRFVCVWNTNISKREFNSVRRTTTRGPSLLSGEAKRDTHGRIQEGGPTSTETGKRRMTFD